MWYGKLPFYFLEIEESYDKTNLSIVTTCDLFCRISCGFPAHFFYLGDHSDDVGLWYVAVFSTLYAKTILEIGMGF